jgi:chromosome segregation ATPase
MIDKLRNMAKVGEEVKKLRFDMKELQNEFGIIREGLEGLKDEMQQMREVHKKHNLDMEETKKAARMLNEEFKNEIYDFKLRKTELNKQVLHKFESELSEALDKQLKALSHDAGQYNNVRRDIEIITSTLANLTKEIDKFNRIASGIKERDYALGRHKKQLDAMDKEKLTLLKKIDSLERLVSKLRRRM